MPTNVPPIPAPCAPDRAPNFARTTIVDDLGELWRADPDYRDYHTSHPRTVSPALGSDPDVPGSLVMGLSYVTDYRTEEERGISDLITSITGPDARRFTMTEDARSRMTVFTDVPGFALSTRHPLPAHATWGTPLGNSYNADSDYADYFTQSLTWAQGLPSPWQDRRTVADLRAQARAANIRPLPTTKAALKAALTAAGLDEPPKHPNQYPAWFHMGTLLVVRADTGVSAGIVARLCAAIEAGTFGIGNGSGVFHSGLFLYDSADDTAEMIAAREARFDLHDARMADLAPVERELRDRGHRFYFLGKPTLLSTDGGPPQVKYWLNGTGSPQPFGWYTLEELLEEKFLTNAAAKLDQRPRRPRR